MLTALLAVLLSLLGLLAIPLRLVHHVNWQGRFQGEIDLYWLFGLIHLRIPTRREASASTARRTHARPRQRGAAGKKANANPLAAWRLYPFRRRIIRFVLDLWRAIHKRDLHLQLRIGLDDPADTGQLWAILGPVSAVLAHPREVEINIVPEFNDSTFEFNSSGHIRIIPLQLIGLILALLLSPSFWQGMRQMRRAC